MPEAYVVGHITVTNAPMWEQYRSKVPQTLAPWKGELVFRGKQVAAFAGECPPTLTLGSTRPSSH